MAENGPAPAVESRASAGEEPPRTALLGMGALLGAVLLVALAMTVPFRRLPEEALQAYQAFPDASDPSNIGLIVGIMLGFTLVFILMIRFGWKLSFRAVFMGVIFLILYSGLQPVLGLLAGLAAAAALTALLALHPEWYVVDAVMLPVSAFAAWLFGISLVVPLVVALLVALAVYDFIAVYRTGHMVFLAEGVLDQKIPILFVLPRRSGFSFRKQTKIIGGTEAFYMGLGDAIIPGMLVVSANLPNRNASLLGAPDVLGVASLPALGAALGTLAGFALLSRYVGRGKPHAGLPFLNTGAILGFLAGAAAAGVRPF